MEGINQGMQNVSGASAKSSVGTGALDAADLKKAGFDPKDFSKAGLDKPNQQQIALPDWLKRGMHPDVRGKS